MYYIYHVFGKKIGVTRNPTERITIKQGYDKGEFEILEISADLNYVSKRERELQKLYGYKVDKDSYKKMVNKNKNNSTMKLNVTDQTITFPCPVKQLKGQLMDALGLEFETQYGKYVLDIDMANWIAQNATTSMFNQNRCYVYNKVLHNWKNNLTPPPVNINDIKVANVEDVSRYVNEVVRGILQSGELKKQEEEKNIYALIRNWAREKGIYTSGNSKTQYIKLMEETGELAQAILKQDKAEIKDAIGDIIVVLTNLAYLENMKVEDCVESAYNVIKNRSGQMVNGTFVKDTVPKKVNISQYPGATITTTL